MMGINFYCSMMRNRLTLCGPICDLLLIRNLYCSTPPYLSCLDTLRAFYVGTSHALKRLPENKNTVSEVEYRGKMKYVDGSRSTYNLNRICACRNRES